MNSLRPRRQNGEPRERTAIAAPDRLAREGNKRRHPSERGPGRRHRGSRHEDRRNCIARIAAMRCL